MKRILFVCTGNTCRSVLAHGLLKNKIMNSTGPLIEIKSAGLAALEGEEASGYALEILKEKGIDFSRHRSHVLTGKLVEEADLILVMTAAHKQELLERFPEAREKTYLISEFASGKKNDIEDPVGGSKEEYLEVASKLEDWLNQIYVKFGF